MDITGIFTVAGFETSEPTMNLRFVNGRLQQLHSVRTYEGGQIVAHGAEWRDVPDATPQEPPDA